MTLFFWLVQVWEGCPFKPLIKMISTRPLLAAAYLFVSPNRLLNFYATDNVTTIRALILGWVPTTEPELGELEVVEVEQDIFTN